MITNNIIIAYFRKYANFPKLQKLQGYDNAILKLKKVRYNLSALRKFETSPHRQTVDD